MMFEMQSTVTPRAQRGVLLGLFLFAFVVRVLFATVGYPAAVRYGGLKAGRSDGYERIARSLLAGDGFRAEPHLARTTMRMPLYPGFLAGIFAVAGEHKWVVQVIQSLLGAATCVIVAVIALRTIGWLPAILAGSAWALYPGDLVACARYNAEPLSILFILLAVLAYLGLLQRPTVATTLMIGLALALATQTKSSNCLLPVVFIFALWLNRSAWRPRARFGSLALAMLAPVFLLSVPWVVRNYAVTGRLIYPSTLGGYGLMDGYYVGANLHTGRSVGDLLHEGRKLQGDLAREHGLDLDPRDNFSWNFASAQDEYAMDRLLKARYGQLVAGDPVGFAYRSVLGIARYWYLCHSPRATWISAVANAPYLFLAFVGAVRAVRMRMHVLWLLALIVIHFNLLNAVIDPLVRYAVSAMPFVCIFAGAAIARRGADGEQDHEVRYQRAIIASD